VAVETSGMSWPERIEDAIRGVESVDGVSVTADNGTISEIHIETSSTKPEKQIVRDVVSILRTRLQLKVNYRIVSVVRARTSAPPPARLATVHPVSSPVPSDGRDSVPGRGADRSVGGAGDRIRYEGVNLYVAGPTVQAQVELRWGGRAHTGSATGSASRDGADRLVAMATVAAVQDFLEDGIGLGVADVQRLKVGDRDVMVVAVSLIAHRSERLLVGSCTVGRDALQAVVLATLAALNRVAGGLGFRESVEYVLRPASAQEASEAEHE
jgi:hypothetical protein